LAQRQVHGGPLWHDFQTACRGLREYELAALVLRDLARAGHPPAQRALTGYGEHDPAPLAARPRRRDAGSNEELARFSRA
jgi:hypothetical protein